MAHVQEMEAAAPTFGDIAHRLERLGYVVVPVPPGQKGPRIKEWPTPVPAAERLPRHARDGVAVLTTELPTLDIDVMNEALNRDLRDAAFEHLGQTLERVGRPPKRALPYRLDGEPFGRMQLAWDGGMVEFLGRSQALTVSAIHPGTGRPYFWLGTPLWECHREGLPAMRGALARQWMRACAMFLEKRGIRPEAYGFTIRPQPPRPSAKPIAEVSDGYIRRALERAAERVSGSLEGTRSDILNREAFSLARFVEGGRLGEDEIRAALLAATTLPKREAIQTINSGLHARAGRS